MMAPYSSVGFSQKTALDKKSLVKQNINIVFTCLEYYLVVVDMKQLYHRHLSGTLSHP